ncbi:MAG: glycine cleavage system protein GcvH [Acidobacteria bacterium]|nr:glycine cleavage system protein GcvH [Acidobacteriota bacterium]
MMYPNDRRYTKDHEWIKLEGSVGTVGITDYAQHELGDVVFVELPAAGAKVYAGKSFGTVESVKAVSEIYSPVNGDVKEINTTLANAPETINTDPHGAAWLIRVNVFNAEQLKDSMDAAAYQTYITEKEKASSH